ncbi:preprotein translocase subunit SecG [Litorimonas haliclonae]|uniref:preprotein translocase subunit SecG n=1 Tax=Litorimonas haliclonae TaxID=2081977 RepID=UPI0039F126D2
MSTVLLIIQLIISVILTGLILIQRSEGGALGIGGGGGGGGLMSGRSATTSIARMTAILGVIFIVNCLALSIVFNMENADSSQFDDTNAVAPLTPALDSNDTTTPLEEETEVPESVVQTPDLAPEETATETPDATSDSEPEGTPEDE